MSLTSNEVVRREETQVAGAANIGARFEQTRLRVEPFAPALLVHPVEGGR